MSKNILIIAAMEEELKPFISDGDYKRTDDAPFAFYTGKMGDHSLLLSVSKIGLVSMGSCAEHFLTRVKYDDSIPFSSIDMVMNIGVGGAISSELEQGDIVVGNRLCQHDMDVTGLGYEIGLNPDYSSVYHDADTAALDAIERAYEKLDTDYRLRTGTIASGDAFISSKEKKDFIEKTFSALACEMEGSALAQVCSDNKVPFLVIRAISDKADGEAPLSYNDFKEKAILNLTELVKMTIGEL
ncbi:MAG: 5'-methylthioadenosine/adenosylhomocysteine nucleosidase [Eubacterium sp.]|nr:5'-methylthioadenosine/adenosylhomocysteine nucleosidase [Eubacterium sp.]